MSTPIHPAEFIIDELYFDTQDALIDPSKLQHWQGLSGSARALKLGRLFKKSNAIFVVVLNDKEQAAYFANDLKAVVHAEDVLFYPFSYKRSFKESLADASSIVLRTEVLSRLQSNGAKVIVVTYPEALIEHVPNSKSLKNSVLEIKVGQMLSIDFVQEVLEDQSFERVDFVFKPGQYALRGSLTDIFSFAHDKPYRIDFFGDEVETIRSFDIQTQLSIDKMPSIDIVPNLQGHADVEQIPFSNYLPDSAFWISEDWHYQVDQIQTLVEKNSDDAAISKQLVDAASMWSDLDRLCRINLGGQRIKGATEIKHQTEPQPAFNKNFDLLMADLKQKLANGYRGMVLSENPTQIDRLSDILQSKHVEIRMAAVSQNLHEGFVDHDLKRFVYTDHQIFNRFHKHQIKTNVGAESTITLQELNELQPGDYVVHQDHGIGKFVGLQTIDVNGKPQESIRLMYQDNDVLFISIHSLHRISKYRGKDGTPPKIYKLGSGAWAKTKATTKKKVKDIAKDLIALYAQRLQEPGFAYSPDTYLQEELEASFMYEDTPDQFKASVAVKEDMERPVPMDRLVCGDVGFGKTEIAVRAAFKAATEGRQTAILVPTTILAFQHYNTFRHRLKDFPVKVEYISRLRTAKQQTEIKKELKEGKIDILIGTHRIVGKDMEFKDLGLLVVDEEQKFGVALKEKLKSIKVNVDTLTLTATPIPRTLQFSLMGARDMSVINTPPPNRYPVQTELHIFNEAVIQEAIRYEVARGGQVFFIHNRVQNIKEVQQLIHRLCPEVTSVIGHGQMDGAELEDVMLDFMDGKYDVLIATTIIESGLDISNANTMIINNAHNFGLSTLHQLRGRVGRTNKKAFAYLLAPDPSVLTDEARRRLKAIEDFSDLGSGFNISLQDLDIRGAGDILGGEQSGFIAEIGFETYQKILQEAIQELKEQEFKSVYEEQKTISAEELNQLQFVNDCQIDTDLELRFPDDYIQNIAERMRLYRELDNLQTDEELEVFSRQLEDRFGPMPSVGQDLIEVVRLRRLAMSLGMERLSLKSGKMKCYFVANSDSMFYQTERFGTVLKWLQFSRKGDLKDVKGRLILTLESINQISKAYQVLHQIYTFEVKNV